MLRRAIPITLALAMLGACRSTDAGRGTAPGNSVAAAAIFTAVGLAGSAVSRASGGCYAECPGGTTCNTHTGLCEPLPCRGLCREGERCVPETDTCEATVAPTLSAESQRPIVRRAVAPEGFDYRWCQSIDPATGLPALPLMPTDMCRGQ